MFKDIDFGCMPGLVLEFARTALTVSSDGYYLGREQPQRGTLTARSVLQSSMCASMILETYPRWLRAGPYEKCRMIRHELDSV